MPAQHTALHILIDRREQRPWTWSEPGINTERCTLATGDYSVAGLSEHLAIERKSLDDLVQTVIHNAQRWHAELERLAAMRAACVIVEGSIPDLFAERYKSHAHPHAVLGRVLSAQLDFQIPVLFAADRPHARLCATAWLARAAKRFSAS